MTLHAHYQKGVQTAFARFKIAAGSLSASISAPAAPPAAASTPTSVSTAAPRPMTPTVAPIASGAAKATVLG